MNLIGKAADPQFWSEIKNKPEFKPMLDALQREYKNDGMDEIPTTKFSKFRLFHDIGDRSIYQEDFFKRQHRAYIMALMSLLYPENESEA